MRIHLQLTGRWQGCRRAQCGYRHHLTDVPVSAAQMMPQPMLELLLGEPLGGQPQAAELGMPGNTILEWRNAEGSLHRDYGLPAQLGVGAYEGFASWWQRGWLKRLGATHLPTRVYPSGRQEWHTGQLLHSVAGRPAVVNANGGVEYWLHGKPAARLPGGGIVLAGRDGLPL